MKVGPCTASRPSAVRAGGLQRWPASALSSHTAAAGSARPDAPQEARHRQWRNKRCSGTLRGRRCGGSAPAHVRAVLWRRGAQALLAVGIQQVPGHQRDQALLGHVRRAGGQLDRIAQQQHVGDRQQRTRPVLVLYHYTHRPTTRPKAYCLELVARWLQRHGWHASRAPQHSLTSSASGKMSSLCSLFCSSEGRAEHAQVSSRVLFLARCLLGPKAVSLRYSPAGKTINLFQAQETLCTHSQANQLTHSSQPLWVSSTRSRGQSQVRRQT